MVGVADAKAEGGGDAAATADDCSPEMGLLGSEDIAFMDGINESMILCLLTFEMKENAMTEGRSIQNTNAPVLGKNRFHGSLP